MTQRGAYFQTSLGGQPSPSPYHPSAYSQSRRSPHESPSSINYSGIGGYGASGAGEAHEVAISQRSRASLGQTHHSTLPADYPRTHHQFSHSPAPAPWDGQASQPYGYAHMSSSSYAGQGQSWPVDQNPQHISHHSYYQRSDFHDQGTQYMSMVGVANGGMPRGPASHVATSPMLPGSHSPPHWSGPSDATSDHHPQSLYVFNMRDSDHHVRPSPEIAVSGHPFSAPSPSSTPSPSRVVEMPSNPGPRRASIDASTNVKQCSHCRATSTPLWRRNPMNMQPLCNACGLYLQQRNKLRPQELIDASIEDDESTDESDLDPSAPRCSHCQTHVTSVWRRSKTGEQLCNACGVYLRLRGKPRPLNLKQKKIKPRPHSSKNTAK